MVRVISASHILLAASAVGRVYSACPGPDARCASTEAVLLQSRSFIQSRPTKSKLKKQALVERASKIAARLQAYRPGKDRQSAISALDKMGDVGKALVKLASKKPEISSFTQLMRRSRMRRKRQLKSKINQAPAGSWDAGYTEGYSAAYGGMDPYEDGDEFMDGYNEGYMHGQDEGFAAGYQAGFADGTAEASAYGDLPFGDFPIYGPEAYGGMPVSGGDGEVESEVWQACLSSAECGGPGLFCASHCFQGTCQGGGPPSSGDCQPCSECQVDSDTAVESETCPEVCGGYYGEFGYGGYGGPGGFGYGGYGGPGGFGYGGYGGPGGFGYGGYGGPGGFGYGGYGGPGGYGAGGSGDGGYGGPGGYSMGGVYGGYEGDGGYYFAPAQFAYTSAPCGDGSNQIHVIMEDTYGDGWNGAWCYMDCAEPQRFYLASGSSGDMWLSLSSSMLHVICTPGGYPSEPSWELRDMGGAVIGSGGSSTELYSAVGGGGPAPAPGGYSTTAAPVPWTASGTTAPAPGGYSTTAAPVPWTASGTTYPMSDWTTGAPWYGTPSPPAPLAADCNATAQNFTVSMTDSYGDGWNGAVCTTDCAQPATFALTDWAAEGTAHFTLFSSTLKIVCVPGGWPEEPGWTVSNADGVIVAEGGSSTVIPGVDVN